MAREIDMSEKESRERFHWFCGAFVFAFAFVALCGTLMVFVGAKLKNTRKNNHELLSLTEEGQLESSEDLQSHKGLDLSSLA